MGEFDFALIAVKLPFHRVALEPLAATGEVENFVSLGNGLIQDRMAEIVGARSPVLVHRRMGRRPTSVRSPAARTRSRRWSSWSSTAKNGSAPGCSRDAWRRRARPPDGQHARPDRVQAARQLHRPRALGRLRPALRRGRRPRGRPGPRTRSGPRASRSPRPRPRLEPSRLDVEPHELVERDDAALRRDGDRGQHRAFDAPGPRAGPRHPGRRRQRRRRGARPRARIATPFNDRVVEVVHAMEESERSPAPDELTQLVAVAGR